MKHPEPIPLGVSDPEGRVGAIAIDGNTDFIDLVTGERLRLLAQIGSPLMIDESYLIGWQRQTDPSRTRLFRVALPPSDAAPVWSDGFDLPTGPELEFDVKLLRDENLYRFYWKGLALPHGGVPPLRLSTHAEGRERIDVDVETFKILARQPEDGFAEEQERASRGEQLARQAAGLIYQQGGQLRNAPWEAPGGERYLRVLGALGAKEQRLAIARVAQPELNDPVEIGTRDALGAPPELSLDGRHLALVENNPGSPFWNIFSTATGQRVGTVPSRNGFAAFRVFGHRLICLEEDSTRNAADLTIVVERHLQCIDLEDGRKAWVYPLPTKRLKDNSFLPPRL
jgi:hypothetical protein